MSPDSVEQVRAFTLLHVADGLTAKGVSPESVTDDFDLLLEGVIDSFGLLDLITAVEAQFGVHLDFEDLDSDDLTVMGPFSRYVAAQVASTAP